MTVFNGSNTQVRMVDYPDSPADSDPANTPHATSASKTLRSGPTDIPGRPTRPRSTTQVRGFGATNAYRRRTVITPKSPQKGIHAWRSSRPASRAAPTIRPYRRASSTRGTLACRADRGIPRTTPLRGSGDIQMRQRNRTGKDHWSISY